MGTQVIIPKIGETVEGCQLLEWFVKKLFWLVFVLVFCILSYYTQIRPPILENHGLYVMGFVDGAFVIVSLLILAIWLSSKMLPDKLVS